MVFNKTPKSIKTHRYRSVFEPEWQMIHNRMNDNAFTFFIGGNGTGKTWAALKRAEILGVDSEEDNSFLFNPDALNQHVFFDKAGMEQKIHELENMKASKIKGYQIILDEAQMTAHAKEWNNREVLEFSKRMSTIRVSRLSVALTMPVFKMVTTDLRLLATYLCEMRGADAMDLERGYSFSKLHYLDLKPFISEFWRARPFLSKKFVHPLTGLETIDCKKLNEIRWDKPGRSIVRGYEKMKKDYRKLISERAVDLAEEKKAAKEKVESKMDASKVVDFVRSNAERYLDRKDRFDWFQIWVDSERINTSQVIAKKVCKFLNFERDKVKGQCV